MAEAELQKDQAPAKAGDAPSMDEILQSIRGVISGDDNSQNPDSEDVLELVEMVEEPTPSPKPDGQTAAAAAPDGKEKSILDDIDEALDDGSAAAAAAPAATPAPEAQPAPAPAPEPVAAAPEVKAEPAAVIAAAPPAEILEVAPAKSESAESEAAKEEDLAEDDDIASGEDGLDSAPKSNSHKKTGRLLGDRAVKESSGSLQELVHSIHDKPVDSPYSRGGTSLEDLVIEAMKPFLAEWLNKNLPVIVRKIVEKEVKRLIPKEEDDY